MGVVNLVLLACVLRATTKKKGHELFSGKKSAPLRGNAGYAYASFYMITSVHSYTYTVHFADSH